MRQHRRNRWTAVAAALVAAWLSCVGVAAAADGSAPEAGDPTLIVIVRHAEKAAQPADDPPLTAAGRQRAERLAGMLDGTDVSAVYSTQFRRTRATGRPLADRRGLPVTVRPIEGQSVAEHSESMAREIASDHAGRAVLVVGHSNTVPQLVRAFSGRAVEPIDEREYDRVYIVSMTRPGSGRVIEAAYPVDRDS